MTLKRIPIFVIAVALLQGCLATTMGEGGTVGPGSSSQILEVSAPDRVELSAGRQLEVAIPIFDPNLPVNSDDWEKRGIWPELRRAEAVYFAVKMKESLQKTQQFGAVRVVPDQSVTGDLYVLGEIDESNGENVGIHIKAVGIDGRVWLSKTFNHRVKEAFFEDARNQGKAPYDPVFQKAADEIVKKLQKKDSEYLQNLRALTEVRFGYSFSEESFSPFLKISGGESQLVAAPADDDPMLQRIRKLRVKDQLFIDRMQTHYDAFEGRVAPSYYTWQEASFTEAKAKRAAKKKAFFEVVGGVLLIAAGVAVAANTDYRSQNSGATTAAAAAAAVGGGYLLMKASETNAQAKFHHDTLMELGRSIDTEMMPQVIKFEETTVELTGNATEQFNQWRRFLKRIYAEEKTPEIQL